MLKVLIDILHKINHVMLHFVDIQTTTTIEDRRGNTGFRGRRGAPFKKENPKDKWQRVKVFFVWFNISLDPRVPKQIQ